MFNLVFARLVDTHGKYKVTIVFLSLVSLILFILISFLNSDDDIIFLVLLGIFAITFFSPILPITESFTNYSLKNISYKYGLIRLWGSISFMACVLIGGWYLDTYGSNKVPFLFVLAGFLTFISAICSPKKEKYVHKRSNKKDLLNLFGNLYFILFIISCSLIQSSHSMYYGFSSIYWKSIGLSGKQIGFLWAWGIVLEIILFYFIGRIKMDKIYLKLLFFCGIVTSLRWLGTAYYENFYALMFFQSFHAFSYGLTHIITIFYIYNYIPSNLQVTGQSIYYSISMGIMTMLLTLLSGYIYKHIGFSEGCLLMMIVVFMSLFIIKFLIKLNIKKNYKYE